MRKKWLLLSLLLSVLLFGLAACGNVTSTKATTAASAVNSEHGSLAYPVQLIGGTQTTSTTTTATTANDPAASQSNNATATAQSASGKTQTSSTAPTATSAANVHHAENADQGPVVLTIKGSGVSRTTTWSLAQLQSLSDGYIEKIYSAVSNWPTKKFFVGKGINVDYLLQKAGIKSSAATITVKASDGYYATFTRDQLLGKSYYYPNLKNGSSSGESVVPPMLAWASKEGSSDLSAAASGNLRFLIGQKSLNCINTAASVQNVDVIEVSTSEADSWEQPTATESTTDGGKQITLHHPHLDQVTIYYTTDGSTPNYNSKVYNPSTTYYQPDLIKPISVTSGMTVKAVVFGFGKHDSKVATFNY